MSCRACKSLQPKCKNKISYICFGRYDSISKFKQTPFEEKNILEWIERIRRIKPDSMIGLSVTTPAKKNITADLIDRLLAANDNLYFVLVGFNMKDKYSSRVLNIKNNFDISNSLVKEFDFIAKSMTDYSVPLNAYLAAQNNVPLFTSKNGFLAEMVERYKIGKVFFKDFLIDKEDLNIDGQENF